MTSSLSLLGPCNQWNKSFFKLCLDIPALLYGSFIGQVHILSFLKLYMFIMLFLVFLRLFCIYRSRERHFVTSWVSYVSCRIVRIFLDLFSCISFLTLLYLLLYMYCVYVAVLFLIVLHSYCLVSGVAVCVWLSLVLFSSSSILSLAAVSLLLRYTTPGVCHAALNRWLSALAHVGWVDYVSKATVSRVEYKHVQE